jgi:protein-tyrosine phosphatase
MGEALLRAHGHAGLHVESAGTATLPGKPADPTARQLMAQRGLSLDGHFSRQIDPELARTFDLLLVMETGQMEWIHAQFPVVRGRVHRWCRWRDRDIPDPYRRGPEAFQQALALMDAGLKDWLQKGILGPRPVKKA